MNKASSKTLASFLLAYTAASVFHFFHNAIYLDNYPNMPDWISQLGVYSALMAIVATGVIGYLFYSLGYRTLGLIVLGAYATFGFDGLGHYALAPVAAHTFTMNLTVWLEVVTAAFLLAVIIVLLVKRFSIVARHDA